MRTLVALLPLAAANDLDGVSALQMRADADVYAKRNYVRRVAGTEGLAHFDRALAAKRHGNCKKKDYDELEKCGEFGGFNILKHVKSGSVVTWAIADGVKQSLTDNKKKQCETFAKDLNCLNHNPCYHKKAIKKMDDANNCDNVKDDAKRFGIDMKQVCDGTLRDVCEGFYNVKQEIFDDCHPTLQHILHHHDRFDCTFKFAETLKREGTQLRIQEVEDEADKHCAGKTTKILGSANCAKAAENMRMKFREMRHHHRPAGCYEYKGTIWFNTVRDGKEAMKNRNWVCSMSSDHADEAKYSASNYKGCAEGYRPIVLDTACEAAAETLGRTYKKIDFKWRPYGCYMWKGKVWYNENEDGVDKKGREHLCVKKTEEPTTSTEAA